eukprot:764518-Hanusia_phi.AAC.5
MSRGREERREGGRENGGGREEGAGGLGGPSLSWLLLAGLVAWFVAVERPKMDGLEEVKRVAGERKAKLEDLIREVEVLRGEAARREKFDEEQQEKLEKRLSRWQEAMEDKLASSKLILQDLQRQLESDKALGAEQHASVLAVLAKLEERMSATTAAFEDLRENVKSSERLDEAFARLQQAEAISAEEGRGQRREEVGGEGRRQEATGGLVEVRGGDWERMKKEGDTWVVLFYTPWCQQCASIAPAFQQAALQAPVHFARVDATEHAQVAAEEQVTGFPTIRKWSRGRVVATLEEEVTVRNLIAFAKKES